MHLKTRNVNTGFRELVEMFNGRSQDGPKSEHATFSGRPNGGRVIDQPVLITFSHPRERVLFNSAVNHNPFFLLYQALWCLAGRNDVKSLVYYDERVLVRSDDSQTLNGAYGYRWRQARYYPPTEHAIADNNFVLVERTQEQPDGRHVKAEAVQALHAAEMSTQKETARRARLILNGIYEQHAQSWLSQHPREKLPWIDVEMTTWLELARRETRMGSPPQWLDYREATRLYVANLIRHRATHAEIRTVLRQLHAAEVQWIQQFGGPYNPPLIPVQLIDDE